MRPRRLAHHGANAAEQQRAADHAGGGELSRQAGLDDVGRASSSGDDTGSRDYGLLDDGRSEDMQDDQDADDLDDDDFGFDDGGDGSNAV